MNGSYPMMLPVNEHESNVRFYEPSYPTYASYGDCNGISKTEAMDYNYWSNHSTTHNLLNLPNSVPSDPSINNITPVDNTMSVPSSNPLLYNSHPPFYESSNWCHSGDYQVANPLYRPCPYSQIPFHEQNQWSNSNTSVTFKNDNSFSPPSYTDALLENKIDRNEFVDNRLTGLRTQPAPPRNPVNGKQSLISISQCR
jgi:hypothetical protein